MVVMFLGKGSLILHGRNLAGRQRALYERKSECEIREREQARCMQAEIWNEEIQA